MQTRFSQISSQLPGHWLVVSALFGASVQFTSHGSEFLLAAPRMFTRKTSGPPSITFIMGTMNDHGASVFITTPYFQPDNESLHELLHLEYRNISTFSPQIIYHSEVYMGPKFSFRFIANATFSLSVCLIQDSSSIASFQAVPVRTWGKKYIAYTLGQYPSIQVVSNTDDNSVLVFFSFHQALAEAKLTYNNVTYSDGRSLQFTLNRWEAFAVSNCGPGHSHLISLTGTVVYGDFPIGVVSGNCESTTFTFGCKIGSRNYRTGETTDIAAEMLLPEEAYGKEFVLFCLPRRTVGSASIMSLEENTEVNISQDSLGGLMPVFLEFAFWRFEVLLSKNRQVVSNNRIMVVIMTLSTCIGRGARFDLGDPAICLVLPNSLFSSEYFWSTPEGIKDNYATVVMEIERLRHIHVNNEPLRFYNSAQVWGNPKYEVCTFRLLPKDNHIFAMHNFKFACYIYGLGPEVQYMHTAGFDGCVDTTDSMFAGDRSDNDCDDDVDEEFDDGLDNDSDGRIDEDLRPMDVTDGMWGEWLPWSCNPNCTHPFYFRYRTCDSPAPSGSGLYCHGEPTAVKKFHKCSPNLVCPRRCPRFTWGEHCNRSCINCGIDCDTDTGRCDYCKMGFKRREAGCNKRCEENEYGHDCLLVCTEKCGSDCANRETGECPGLNIYLMFLCASIVITLGLLLMWLRKRSQKANTSFMTVMENYSEVNASVLSSVTEAEQMNVLVPGAEAASPFETALI